MKVDETNKVIIETVDDYEAKVLIQFLKLDIARHERDIEDAKDLILKILQRFY